ncbi:MAG: S41 family peptidase [Cytophagales bacterium]|nr:S41 family peptidase [Cytophagales bacterium]
MTKNATKTANVFFQSLLRKGSFWIGLLSLSLLLLSLKEPSPRYFEILKNLEIFTSLYRQVNAHYIEETSPTQLMHKGIHAMLASLDPFTNFIPEEDIEEYRMQFLGKYGGIGIKASYAFDSSFVVTEIYDDSPIQDEEIQVGDKIVKLGDIVLDKNVRNHLALSRLIRGEEGSILSISVQRYGEDTLRHLRVRRKEINIKSVPYYGMLESTIGYIKLLSFSNHAGRHVREALRELKKQGAKQIVLDLRGNPGGLLQEAVSVANVFIPKGMEIVSSKGRTQAENQRYTTQHLPTDTNIRMVVLIDSHSASASEIVAGVIQDYDRGILVGRKTFGKGLVQTSVPLEYNARLKITTARYYIPSGRYIQEIEHARDKTARQGNKKFFTRNKRPVYAQNGISPDLEVGQKRAEIVDILHEKKILFEFATRYRHHHPKPPNLNEFSLGEAAYEDFLGFLKNYSLALGWQTPWNQLEEYLEQHSYKTPEQDTQWTQTKKILKDIQNQQLRQHKEQISQALSQVIIQHYYPTWDQVAFSLKYDKDLNKAREVLRDTARYEALLLP